MGKTDTHRTCSKHERRWYIIRVQNTTSCISNWCNSSTCLERTTCHWRWVMTKHFQITYCLFPVISLFSFPITFFYLPVWYHIFLLHDHKKISKDMIQYKQNLSITVIVKWKKKVNNTALRKPHNAIRNATTDPRQDQNNTYSRVFQSCWPWIIRVSNKRASFWCRVLCCSKSRHRSTSTTTLLW